MTLYNNSDAPALVWFAHAVGGAMTVEPGRPIPQDAIMLTRCAVGRQVVVWSSSSLEDNDDDDQSIIHPTSKDVLGGRGNHGRDHSGNLWFRQFVGRFQTDYRFAASSRDKARILDKILTIANQENRRFLQLVLHDRQRDVWKWILAPKPRAKVCEMIRGRKGTTLAKHVARVAASIVVDIEPDVSDEELALYCDGLFDEGV